MEVATAKTSTAPELAETAALTSEQGSRTVLARPRSFCFRTDAAARSR